MKRTAFLSAAAALAALVVSASASAQDTVSAADPAGLARAMKFAGFDAELTTDDVGDPMIRTSFDGYTGVVLFYDCDAETHEGCASIQLHAGLDRKQPMAADMALSLARRYRFASVHLDEEGDPWINWDVLTGDGLPREIFVKALRRYAATLDNLADEVFAEERGN